MVVIGIVCMIAKISCTKYGKNEWIVFMISFAFSLLLLYAKEDETISCYYHFYNGYEEKQC